MADLSVSACEHGCEEGTFNLTCAQLSPLLFENGVSCSDRIPAAEMGLTLSESLVIWLFHRLLLNSPIAKNLEGSEERPRHADADPKS